MTTAFRRSRTGLYVPRAGGGGGYDGEVMADSPMGFWPAADTAYNDLGGGSSTAVDASGNGHTAFYTGTYTLNQASIMPTDTGPSVRIQQAALSVLGNSWLVNGMLGSWAIEGWFKFDTTGYNRGVFGRYQNGSGAQDGLLWMGGTGVINANWHVASGYSQTSNVSVTTGVGYHLVMEYDMTAGKLRLYVNGSLAADVAGTGASQSSASQHLNFGAYTNISYWTDGWMQKLAVYDHALGATRVAAHYAAG